MFYLQTFVRLANLKTGQEVIFTADADASKMYKFNLDVAESGRDFFQYLSGKYTLELIVGDAVVQNPLLWNLVSKSLKLVEEWGNLNWVCLKKKNKVLGKNKTKIIYFPFCGKTQTFFFSSLIYSALHPHSN